MAEDGKISCRVLRYVKETPLETTATMSQRNLFQNFALGLPPLSGLSGWSATATRTSWPSCTVCGRRARYGQFAGDSVNLSFRAQCHWLASPRPRAVSGCLQRRATRSQAYYFSASFDCRVVAGVT